MDVYFPGTARLYADAYAEKIRPHLPVQFCGRLCVWRTDGSSRALDYTSSGKSAAARALFVLSYLILCFGIALSKRCKLPIVPTDLFPREVSDITKVPYSRIKIGFDVTCLMVTALLTFFGLGRIEGLGIGTVAAAFTMGKGIVLMGKLLDKKFAFVSVLSPERP